MNISPGRIKLNDASAKSSVTATVEMD